MPTSRPSAGYHILALATIFVWGTTFASTKVLLTHGLTPPEIMFYRFVIAYALTWIFSRKLWADTWADELYLALAGFTGGTLYFLAENTAINYTITSNVALVVCVTPVLTALLTSLIYRERITSRLAIGSLVALMGVGFVVLNGAVLKIHPLGDTLALVAALAWAIYSVVIRRFDGRYTTWFVTRKVFFYGIITMLPFIAAGMGGGLHLDRLAIPVVAGNVLFLSVVASMLCFYTWNLVLENWAPSELPTTCTPNPSYRSSALLRYWMSPSPISPSSEHYLSYGVFISRKSGRASCFLYLGILKNLSLDIKVFLSS